MTSAPLVYAHGLPGAADEVEVFGPPTRAPLIGLHRLRGKGATYDEALLDAFDEATAGCASVDVFGFSLGAMAALRIAAARPEKVGAVLLASPAAPLELGAFLPHMAGRPVFEAARRGPAALGLLCLAQRLAVRLAWPSVRGTMFASAAPAEQALIAEPRVDACVRDALRACLGRDQRAYRRELFAYVAPWADVLGAVAQPVTIWQGDRDTWTPPAMAEALCAALPRATITTCAGLGHYSTLAAALRSL